MMDRLISLLVKCYPSAWRSEYGAEMEDLLKRQRLTLPRICDVLGGALRERVRHAQLSLFARLGLVSFAPFMIAVSCGPLLWQLTSAPVVEVLKRQNTQPPILAAALPWEQAFIVWLGIPLLLTLLVLYPVSMALACRKVISSQASKMAAARSAALYTAGFAAGLVAWQCGSCGWLLKILPESQNVRPLSVGECFGLLVASTFGTAVTLQLPLLLYRMRFRPGSAK